MKKGYPKATLEDVFAWLMANVFSVEDTIVSKLGEPLAARVHKRKGMEDGDIRVDLFHDGKRRSVFVSQIVWMVNTKQIIPANFEIHHRDNNPHNNQFSNLLCLHKYDHEKIHKEEEIPF